MNGMLHNQSVGIQPIPARNKPTRHGWLWTVIAIQALIIIAVLACQIKPLVSPSMIDRSAGADVFPEFN